MSKTTQDAREGELHLLSSINKKRLDLERLVQSMEHDLQQLKKSRAQPSQQHGDADHEETMPVSSRIASASRSSSLDFHETRNGIHGPDTLSARVACIEKEIEHVDPTNGDATSPANYIHVRDEGHEEHPWKWPLTAEEYKRYGRQVIVPEVGLKGQQRLRQASVLIVGVGGLGCPAAAYLAGAGVGHIGLVDGDVVEKSNLHRQILHATHNINVLKVDSAIQALRRCVACSCLHFISNRELSKHRLNPAIQYTPHREHLTPTNSCRIFASYDVVLDCTDHPISRYLISDTAVLLRKPLVSASALRTEGQLIVLNNPARPPGDAAGGPCYRCIFPKPPPVDSVVSCGEGGILGPVVGVMGVLQALEAMKLIVKGVNIHKGGEGMDEPQVQAQPPTLHLFSAFNPQPFRSIRMRTRRKNCMACSAQASISKESLLSGSLDYIQFCGVSSPINVLGSDERISASRLADLVKEAGQNYMLIDVREAGQFELCSLPTSINIPFSEVSGWTKAEDIAEPLRSRASSMGAIHVICRLGNDSQAAVKKLKEFGFGDGERYLGDITGGLRAWRRDVDPTMPDI